MGVRQQQPEALATPKEGGKFRYLIYDLDFGLGLYGSVTNNMLSVARNPSPQNYNSDIFDALTQNTVFRRYFINRYADLINTIFLPSNVQQVAYMYRDTISTDMAYQFAWGSNNSDWLSNIQSMLTFASQRPSNVRGQIQSEFGLSGQVTLTLQVQPAGAGRIEISTITPTSLSLVRRLLQWQSGDDHRHSQPRLFVRSLAF